MRTVLIEFGNKLTQCGRVELHTHGLQDRRNNCRLDVALLLLVELVEEDL
jgi:hypothetical protein